MNLPLIIYSDSKRIILSFHRLCIINIDSQTILSAAWDDAIHLIITRLIKNAFTDVFGAHEIASTWVNVKT